MSDLYLDAYSGISGDMMLGALLDLGVPREHLVAELERLALPGWRLEQERVEQHGVTGTRANVHLDDGPQPHRHLSDIRAIIHSSSLSSCIQEDALGVFELLAHAEARVHGAGVEEVHFHEVGAVDAIIDIVGACVGLAYLGVSQFDCSPLPLGTGFVRAAHGTLPLPAPATLEILAGSGATLLPGQGEGEMVTPTGAALVAHFGRFEDSVVLRPTRIGYGFGTRVLPWPNALRAILTEEAAQPTLETDAVTLLECNVDDMSAEVFPYV
ncbi:MAG: nickel pincer cofactor biosynthesis protein LarC, partial [Chloroflexia bacterium]|nr:nickel pincer cofactor biosynthesis protein LarC [Chloroflexia bacterium]